MIPFVLFFTALLLALAEILSRRDDLRHLHLAFSLDSPLVEPGEVVTLRYTVRNTGILPVLYAGLMLQLGPGLSLKEDEAFLRRHVAADFSGTRVKYHFYLSPRRQFSGKVHLLVQKRGLYALGKYYLESGDFLGLKPTLRSDDIGARFICTAAPCDIPRLKTLGGELGTIPVHRFIQDDPTMVLGYRDYTGREPMRQISWNQTAKANRLIVRQNDFTTDRTALVIVNMDPTHPPLMERCLSMTGTVCRLLEKEKIPYALQSNGDLFSLREGLGAAHLSFIERRIGLSRLTGYTGLTPLVSQCMREKRSGCTYIVITPTLDEDCQAAIARLARHADHKPIILCAEEEEP